MRDEISEIRRGSHQMMAPCPNIAHGLTPEIRKHAADCPVDNPDPLAVCTCSGEEQEVLVDAQGIAHPAIREDCPNCHKSELRTKDDYICYRCRDKSCSQCGGTGLVGGGKGVPAFIREASNPIYNGWLAKEAGALHALNEAFNDLGKGAFIPRLLETRQVNGIRSNIFADDGWDLSSLEAIREAYPNGIDPKDMAWIFRRLLLTLGIANENGYAHGAILPPNVLVEPAAHGIVLVNWAQAVKRPGRITSVIKRYRAWYPPEVFAKQNVLVGTDIFMAAKCMEWVMEGQDVPRPIALFLTGCQNPNAGKRPNNAREVYAQFNSLIERVWGERKFHPFSMPTKEGV